MSQDLLADALNIIKTHEHVGKKECTIKNSRLIQGVMQILKDKNYIKNFEYIEDGKGGLLKIELAGHINDCNVIKPRLPVRKSEWALWEQKYIPGVGFGYLIVSTPYGLMTNEDAKAKGIGGRLISYVF